MLLNLRESNPQPSDYQLDTHPTEPMRPAQNHLVILRRGDNEKLCGMKSLGHDLNSTIITLNIEVP